MNPAGIIPADDKDAGGSSSPLLDAKSGGEAASINIARGAADPPHQGSLVADAFSLGLFANCLGDLFVEPVAFAFGSEAFVLGLNVGIALF